LLASVVVAAPFSNAVANPVSPVRSSPPQPVSYNSALLAPPATAPFFQTSWPTSDFQTPRAPDATQQTNINLFTNPIPFAQYDWPVVRGIDLVRSRFVGRPGIGDVPLATPFVQSIWEPVNPVPSLPPQLVPYNANLYTVAVQAAPFAQLEWKPVSPPSRALDATRQTNINLFTNPIPFAQYDWPTVRGVDLVRSRFVGRAGITDASRVSPPFLPYSQLLCSTSAPFANPKLYRSLVGALQYLTITRPDLTFAVNSVSQFLQEPRDDHFSDVTKILRYVSGTLHCGLTFSSDGVPEVLAYSDADWARCLETRRSTYGYAVFLGGNLVSWSAKKQPTVSRSSSESEYRALANTAAEVAWLTNLLRDLQFPLRRSPLLLCDNNSAIFLAENPVAHKRAKHIDIDYHFVREMVTNGKVGVTHVPSSLQVADIFTKGLNRTLFEFFRSKLRVSVNPTLRLRGGVTIEDINED
jgi:hypothetical protein